MFHKAILTLVLALTSISSANASEVNEHKALMDKQLICYALWFAERTGLKGTLHKGLAINLGATQADINSYFGKFSMTDVSTNNFQAKAEVHDEYRKKVSALVNCDGADSEYWALVKAGTIKHINSPTAK